MLPIQQALERAEKAGLDLVEVAPNADPPVCRIIDFGKYLYEVDKKERTARKKQVIVHVKEIRFRPKIGEHDYQTKLRNAVRFLERGDRVKITMMFRGREAAHRENGLRILGRLLEDLKEYAEIEKNYTLDNQSVVNILVPKKKLGVKKSIKTDDGSQKSKTAGSAVLKKAVSKADDEEPDEEDDDDEDNEDEASEDDKENQE